MFERLHHVSMLVEDLSRAQHFYCDVLGLAIDSQRPDLGYPGLWLKVGDQQIHLMQLPAPTVQGGVPQHGGRDRHAAFHVNDLDGLLAQLEAAGIDYTQSKSGRAAAFCRDPDGNALEFIQSPRPDD